MVVIFQFSRVQRLHSMYLASAKIDSVTTMIATDGTRLVTADGTKKISVKNVW